MTYTTGRRGIDSMQRLARVLATVIALTALAACGGSDGVADEEAGSTGVEQAGSESPTTTATGQAASERETNSAASNTTAKPTASAEAGSKVEGKTEGAGEQKPAEASSDGRRMQDDMSRQADALYGDMPIEVTLGAACVQRGGTQSITIKAMPRSAVGFDSYYADGKTGLSEGFYGGNAGAPTDESGTWSHSWAISPAAPLGRVVVQVVAKEPGGQSGSKAVEFTLAEVGRC